jgi:hypothetical protein
VRPRQKANESRRPTAKPEVEECLVTTASQAAERKAALAYEREQKVRDRERAREEVARQKERERRQQAVDKAQAAFDAGEREHAKTSATIQAEADALEKRSQAEDARWAKQKDRLHAALRRARD